MEHSGYSEEPMEDGGRDDVELLAFAEVLPAALANLGIAGIDQAHVTVPRSGAGARSPIRDCAIAHV
jgi:hypothetical protein